MIGRGGYWDRMEIMGLVTNLGQLVRVLGSWLASPGHV